MGTETRFSLISDGVRVVGTNGGSTPDLATIGAHRIDPVIDHVLPLAGLEDGHRSLDRGGHFGKVAISIDG